MASVSNYALTLSNVSFKYTLGSAVSKTTKNVGVGDFIGLVGPNGAGKTTLLKLCCALLKPTTGEVRMFDQKITDLSTTSRARLVATVPQRFQISLPFTVEQLVTMGRFPYVGNLATLKEDDKQAIEEAMTFTRLEKLRYRQFSKLSGGEQQRCFVARAIAQQAKILLLDEPTSQLDIRHTAEVVQTLQQLNRQNENPVTIILATHDLNLAANHAKRVWLMSRGDIIADDRVENALTQENIEATFGCAVNVSSHPITHRPQVSASI